MWCLAVFRHQFGRTVVAAISSLRCNFSFTMAKFASVLALLISGASAFVSQNGAAKHATALRAADGVWDPMVGRFSFDKLCRTSATSRDGSEKDMPPRGDTAIRL